MNRCSSEQMVSRLMAASLNPWVKIAFGQLFGSAKSEKTTAGIIATASILFTRFMAKNTLGCFVGKTTLPTKLKRQQMIIFGLNRSHRDAISPLMTSILHMTVAKNIEEKRLEPLITVLDELPTTYLPDLYKWINESRSEGFCGILGWQNMGQLEKSYGKEAAKAIVGACGTKFIFNPGENESAQLFSSYLGDEEVRHKQKSRSSNGNGGKSSITISWQEKVKKLLESSQFLKLRTGKCVFINPAYANREEGSVPLLIKIRIPLYLKMIDKYNERNWGKVVKMLTRTSTQRIPTSEDLSLRVVEVDRRFPLTNKGEASSNNQAVNSVLTINEVNSILNSNSDVVVI